jgi:hypothetical protein
MNSVVKIKHWLHKQGFALDIGYKQQNEVCFETKVVSINSRLSLGSQVVTLLHECGHILIFNRRRRNPSKRIAGATLHKWIKHGYSKFVPTLMEEIEAWERGLTLASRIRVRKPKNFGLIRTQCIMSYVRWGGST